MESSAMDESKSVTITEDIGDSFVQSSEDVGYFEGECIGTNEGAGPLFNDSVGGSEALGIGFEESDIYTNEVLDDATSALLDQSSVLQLNEDLDNLHDAYKASRQEVKDLTKRMKSRTILVDKIRSAYLRDVVTVKHILNDVLTGKEKKMVMDEFVGRLPSVDLGGYLDLYKPPNTKMRLKRCEECGGHVDVIIKDSDHVERLMKVIEKYKDREEHMGLTIATQDAEAEANEKKRQTALREHRDEKNVLYTQLKKLNADLAVTNTENEKMKKSTGGYRDEIRTQKAEIDRLLLKEQRLADLEVEANEYRMQLRSLTGDVSKQEDEVNQLRKDLDESQVKCRKLQDSLDQSQAFSRELDAKVQDYKKEEKKLKDLNEFLEKNLEEKSVAVVKLEGQVLELKEEKQFLESESATEVEALNKVTEGLTDENNKLESALQEKKQSEISLQKALKAAESLIAQKDSTIKSRELEMRALAAEVEALQEELSALKQFVSDTVASRRTPSRARREIDDLGEDEMDGTWQMEDDSTLASDNDSINAYEGPGSPESASTTSGKVKVRGESAAAMRATIAKKGVKYGDSEEPIAPKESRPMREENTPEHEAAQKHVKYDESASSVQQAHGHVVLDKKEKQSPEEMLAAESPQPKLKKHVSIEENSQSTADGAMESHGTQSRPTGHPKGEAEDAVEFNEDFPADAQGRPTKVSINAPTHSDVTTSKVAPPTVQANTKKKVRHDMRVVEQTQVDLLGPSEDASAGELMIRDAVILALKPEMGSNATKKAMNACRDIFTEFGRMLTDSFESVWNASLLSKRGLDLLVKAKTVSGSILSMSTLQMGDKEAHMKLGDMVSDVVPIIGSDVGLKLSEKWQGDISLHKAVAQLMIPTIDTNVPEGSPNNVVWETFDRFFGDKKRDYSAGLKEMKKALKDMTDYFDYESDSSNSALIDMVKDWAEAKAVYYDMENRLDHRAAMVKKEMMTEIETIRRELGLANGRFDAAKTFSKKLEVKLETATRRVNELDQLPPKISALEAEIAMLRKSKEEQAALIIQKEQAIENAAEKDTGQTEKIITIEKTIEDMKEAISTSSKMAIKYEQACIYETQLKEKAELIIKEMKDKEERRVKGMTDKSTDTALLMIDRELQTDFMTYPMSLRTKFVSPQLKKGGKSRGFTVNLVEAPEYVKDVEFMSESAVAHGAQRISSLPKGLKGITKVKSQGSGMTMHDVLLGKSEISTGHTLDAGVSTISHEVRVGTEDGHGIGVTVRATSPQDTSRGRSEVSYSAQTNTVEFGRDITDRLMNQLERQPSVPNSDNDSTRHGTASGRGSSTPLSYVLSDDVDDDFRSQTDDLSVGSSLSHLSQLSYGTTVNTLGSSHATDTDYQASMMLSRSISSPIVAKKGRSGGGKRGGSGSRALRNNNAIPPLQRTSEVSSREKKYLGRKNHAGESGAGGDLRYFDNYLGNALPYDSQQASLFAAKDTSMYAPHAEKRLHDLKKSFFGKK